MKKEFPEFYSLSKDEITALWEGCIFAFDANVLLNLYRYSLDTSDNLISILKNFSDRIWMPHQFALEYQRNRMVVIEGQRVKYMGSIKNILGELEVVEELLGNYYGKMPFDIKKIKNDLLKSQEEYPGCTSEDKMREEIDALFENKVGSPFDEKRMLAVIDEGKERYQKEMPPGYCDALEKDKNDPTKTRKYGDLIGWLQMIEKAKTEKKPLVFITSERKEDWWQIVKGKTVGPRHELLKEFQKETGEAFHMYDMKRFLDYAKEKHTVKKKTIDEVIKIDEVYNNSVASELGVVVGGDTPTLSDYLVNPVGWPITEASSQTSSVEKESAWIIVPENDDGTGNLATGDREQ